MTPTTRNRARDDQISAKQTDAVTSAVVPSNQRPVSDQQHLDAIRLLPVEMAPHFERFRCHCCDSSSEPSHLTTFPNVSQDEQWNRFGVKLRQCIPQGLAMTSLDGTSGFIGPEMQETPSMLEIGNRPLSVETAVENGDKGVEFHRSSVTLPNAETRNSHFRLRTVVRRRTTFVSGLLAQLVTASCCAQERRKRPAAECWYCPRFCFFVWRRRMVHSDHVIGSTSGGSRLHCFARKKSKPRDSSGVKPYSDNVSDSNSITSSSSSNCSRSRHSRLRNHFRFRNSTGNTIGNTYFSGHPSAAVCRRLLSAFFVLHFVSLFFTTAHCSSLQRLRAPTIPSSASSSSGSVSPYPFSLTPLPVSPPTQNPPKTLDGEAEHIRHLHGSAVEVSVDDRVESADGGSGSRSTLIGAAVTSLNNRNPRSERSSTSALDGPGVPCIYEGHINTDRFDNKSDNI